MNGLIQGIPKGDKIHTRGLNRHVGKNSRGYERVYKDIDLKKGIKPKIQTGIQNDI